MPHYCSSRQTDTLHRTFEAMSIEYHPAATRGQQFAVNGVRLSRLDAFSALRSSGLSISEANMRLAEAKLRAALITGAG